MTARGLPAWIDAPAAAEQLPPRFTVRGWAFRDGVGIERVEVLVDGRMVARAEYGIPQPGIRAFWRSSDPQQPRVGFSAEVDASGLTRGTHWLGLRLVGRDGVAEDWAEQPFTVGE